MGATLRKRTQADGPSMTQTTPHCAYGNEKTADQVIDDLRQEIVCLKSALEDCDQIVVKVWHQIDTMLRQDAANSVANTMTFCASAQTEIRARIRDATGN